MSNAMAVTNAIEACLVQGDLSKLSADQRLSYYKSVCDSLGLNTLTKPFDYITLNGKLTLYAKRDATDQLRKLNGVSIQITGREVIEGIYVVTARAKDKSGREDESTGAVSIDGLKGEARANAMLKSETKAKRRVTLSICGLGLLDETEVESVHLQEQQEARPNLIREAKAEIASVAMDPGQYIPTDGRYKGQKLCNVDIYQLEQTVSFMINNGGAKKPWSIEFMKYASEFLASRTPKESLVDKHEDIPF